MTLAATGSWRYPPNVWKQPRISAADAGSLRTAYQTTCGWRGFKWGPFWGLDMPKVSRVPTFGGLPLLC